MTAGVVPASTSTSPRDDVRIADPDRRFHAWAIDRLVACGLDLAVAAAAVRYLDHAVLAVAVIAATVLLVGALFAVLVGTTGASPGKALLGLRVVDTGTGGPIGIGPALLRTSVLGVAAVPFGFGLAALAWTTVADTSGLRRGWHDHLVSSIVLDTRPVPDVVPAEEPTPQHVVNLTALRLAPSPPEAPPARVDLPARSPSRPRHAALPTATWGLVLDHGDRVDVDTLVLLGRHPEPRPGEQGARLVSLPSADLSVSQTHAQVVVARDGALVVTDRGAAVGTTVIRRGLSRRLRPGRPTTLIDGDVVVIGDRTMTVRRTS